MAARDEFYDVLETREVEVRTAEQMAALVQQVAHAKANAPYLTERLSEVAPEEVRNREALAELPVTRKSDLSKRQQADAPFGGLIGVPVTELKHIFMSPGPLYEPDGYDKDYWRFGRALWAAGVRPGEIVHNTFSYHLTPAGMLVETAAHAVGCPVFPAGIGNTELQVQAIADIRPSVYCGTPSFLRILVEKGDELGHDTSSLKKGLVGGEALTPSLRELLSGRGIEVSNTYGTADLGLIAYESSARQGMVIDEGIIVEIVEPGGTRPVPEGEVGEVVVTTLNPVYPLLRFATGDLSAVLPGPSPCGRTNMRIKGWMGRADQSTKVKGMFVHPSNVAEVVGRHPEISKARLVVDSVDNVDVMTLRVAVGTAGDDLKQAIAGTIQAVLKLRGQVEFVEAADLPDDGKIIDDVRSYQ